jgi:hypothetical protein
MLLLNPKDGQRKYFSLLFRQTHKYQHPVENKMNAPQMPIFIFLHIFREIIFGIAGKKQ